MGGAWAWLFVAWGVLLAVRGWRALERVGVSTHFGYVLWRTTAWNRPVQRLARQWTGMWRRWFALGAWVAVDGMIIAVFLLINNLASMWRKPDAPQMFEPVVPGVNLPVAQLPYLWIAVVVSVVVHEVGHALAAVVEGVELHGFGFFVMLFFPGGYCRLGALEPLDGLARLRVACAGAWHNVVLCAVAALLVSQMPLLAAPGYESGVGAVVADVQPGCVLAGHVRVGDALVRVNGRCDVRSVRDMTECVREAAQQHAHDGGFCIRAPVTAVATTTQRPPCCNATHYTGALQCMRVAGGAFDCVSAAVLMAAERCGADVPCSGLGAHSCAQPVLGEGERIMWAETREGKRVVVAGAPHVLVSGVTLGDYHPRLVDSVLTHPMAPVVVERAVRYTFSFSAALALLNMAPVFFLDGHHTCAVVMQWLFPRHSTLATRMVLLSGTALLMLNLVLSLVRM